MIPGITTILANKLLPPLAPKLQAREREGRNVKNERLSQTRLTERMGNTEKYDLQTPN